MKIHLCAIQPFLTLMFSSIWSIVLLFLETSLKGIFDIPARTISGPIRSATYLIKFSAASSSDKNFTELFAVSQPLSDTLGKISWKIVVVGSCYRWFRGNLCFSETYFPPTPRVLCRFIRELANKIVISICCLLLDKYPGVYIF